MKLIACVPILHHTKIFQPGEKLPANYPELVEAWIEAGSAKWSKEAETEEPPKETGEPPKDPEEPPKTEEEPTEEPKAEVKAKPVTDQVGQTGTAIPSSGEDLAGRVPSTSGRTRK